jgi:hypothetical protein
MENSSIFEEANEYLHLCNEDEITMKEAIRKKVASSELFQIFKIYRNNYELFKCELRALKNVPNHYIVERDRHSQNLQKISKQIQYQDGDFIDVVIDHADQYRTGQLISVGIDYQDKTMKSKCQKVSPLKLLPN